MYRLRLSGDNTWLITADADRRALLEEMARVMELEPVDGFEPASRLVFTGPDGVTAHVAAGDDDPQLAYQDAKLTIWWFARRQDAVCEFAADLTGDDVYQALRMTVQIIHHRNVLCGGLTLHGALVEFAGNGILLAARGGTGKSTCCRRLPSSWKAWCDDETMLIPDGAGGYLAHPFPTWSHFLDGGGPRTWSTERAVPVGTVFFLEQAPQDQVVPLRAYEIPMWLYHSVFPIYQRHFGLHLKRIESTLFNTRIFDNACDLAHAVSARALHVSLDGRFWEKIEEVLDLETA